MSKYCSMLLILLLIPVLVFSACGGGETTTTQPLGAVVFILKSSVFESNEPIPKLYAYNGDNKSPPLSWSGAPEGTVSFALIMEDPGTPRIFTHWIVYNIPSGVLELAEGQPRTPTLDNGALQGRNEYGIVGYDGPSPLSGTHHYSFRLYALDTMLNLPSEAIKSLLLDAMQGHILGEAELIGTYGA
jgi:Raf kinase inhibitor-like YbhB/YbcL family protein